MNILNQEIEKVKKLTKFGHGLDKNQRYFELFIF